MTNFADMVSDDNSFDDSGYTAEEQFRREVEADRIAAEARDAEAGNSEDEATATVDSAPEPEPEPEPVVEYDDVPAPFTVRLAFPLTVDGVRLEQISLRPPSFRDVQSVVTGAIPEIEMQANMAGVTVAALGALRWPDMEAVATAARHLAPEMER